MVVSKERKKDLPSGKKASSAGLRRLGGVIATAAFFLKKQRKTRYILKIPKTKPIGKVFYTVQSTIEPVTFTKHKDAKHFQHLLLVSTNSLSSDIVRREVTNEGYEPTYGD